MGDCYNELTNKQKPAMDLLNSNDGLKNFPSALTEWDGNMLLFCLRRINAERSEFERLSYIQFYKTYSRNFI